METVLCLNIFVKINIDNSSFHRVKLHFILQEIRKHFGNYINMNIQEMT